MQFESQPTSGGRPLHSLAASLILIVGLAAACAGPPPVDAAQTATAASTAAAATATPVESTPTLTQPATATAAPTALPTATAASRSLRQVQPGESLSLLAEIPVLRVDFGLRSTFSPSGLVLYHTGVGPQIAGDDFASGESVLQLGEFPRGAPHVLELSPAGDILVAEDGSTVGVWQLPGGERLASLDMPSMFPPQLGGFLGTDSFFAGDSSGNVVLWDTETWQERSRMFFHGLVDAAFVLPSGEAVVMLLRDETELRIVDWSGQQIRSVALPATPWRFLGLSPDGTRALLHVDFEKSTEGILVSSLENPQDALSIPLLNIRAMAVSDDWSTLAATDVGERLHLIDPRTGERFHGQQLDTFQVMGLSLSPDATLLAVHSRSAGSASGTIQVLGRALP